MSYKGELNNLCEHIHTNYVNLKKLLISGVTWEIFLVSVSIFLWSLIKVYFYFIFVNYIIMYMYNVCKQFDS